MITLTFETWEEFDNAIAGIVSLETELAKQDQGTPPSLVCSLFFFEFFYKNVYRTSLQNIQILVDLILKIFSDFQGIKRCIIYPWKQDM